MLKKFRAAAAFSPFPGVFARQPLPWRLLLTFLAYLGIARLTSAIGTTALGILVPFWPPAGIALAALLLGGSQLWPAIALATLASALLSGMPVLAGLTMGLGNALGAWASSRLLRGPLHFSPTLERPRDVIHLCFSAPALSGMLSGLIGIAALWLSGQVALPHLFTAWRSWWIGDIAGAQLMAPFLLAWLQPPESFPSRHRDHLAVTALSILMLACLWFVSEQAVEPLAYSGLLLLLCLIWIGFSFELRVVTLALVGLALLTCLFAAQGAGPFSSLDSREMQVKLQVFIAAASTMTLALAAANRQRRAAEQERSRLAAHLDEVLDSLDDVIWTLDPVTQRFTYFSGAMGRLFQRPGEDFCRTPGLWLQQVHPEDKAAALAAFQRVFVEPVDHEFRVVDGNGDIHWMRAHGRPVRNQEGQVWRIDGITQDITSLRQATARLAASEERLRRALGASEVGVWDMAVASGTLHFVLAVPIDGRYDLADRTVSLAEWEASLHPEDRCRAMQALEDCRQKRRPRFLCEYRMRTRQGHWRWYRGEGQVVDSAEDGTPLRLAGIFRDVHERKLVEEELEKLSMAVEQNPSMVFITDAQGQFEYCNAAFTTVTGYGLEDILGQTPRLLSSGRHEAGIYAALWRTITAGETWRGRLINRRQDGSFYTCLQAVTPIRNASGNITHFVSISQEESVPGAV